MKGRIPPGGWIGVAGVVLLAAWIPLLRYPSLSGAGVVPFLCSFTVAGLAYLWALKRLDVETPPLHVLWGFAVAFRLVLLLTPVTLSDDVYRYIWDGHLLSNGVNPYVVPVQSALLDGYDTPLRARVNFPWMATPYLPAAQVYFAVVNQLAPQSPFAFQLSAAVLDLATGALLMLTLRNLRIARKVILVYLWNPLVMVEFAHGAHVDALMVFFMAAALWAVTSPRRGAQTLSALALAAGVLVKGWPGLIAPLFVSRWGPKRVILFGLTVALPLVLFAAGAGWGISGPADGRGVFGALRIYAAAWSFNSGLYLWIDKALGAPAARMIAVMVPALAGLGLGWLAWRKDAGAQRISTVDAASPRPAGSTRPAVSSRPAASSRHAVSSRRLLRWTTLPLGLYLLLSPTVHPWYLTGVLALLPYFWPAEDETDHARRWVWPWMYFMFVEAFTYLAYSGVGAPVGLDLIQTVGYVPFWLLLVWAGLPALRNWLDLSRILRRIKEDHVSPFG